MNIYALYWFHYSPQVDAMMKADAAVLMKPAAEDVLQMWPVSKRVRQLKG